MLHCVFSGKNTHPNFYNNFISTFYVVKENFPCRISPTFPRTLPYRNSLNLSPFHPCRQVFQDISNMLKTFTMVSYNEVENVSLRKTEILIQFTLKSSSIIQNCPLYVCICLARKQFVNYHRFSNEEL